MPDSIRSNIKIKILEWNTYLPAVKNQSTDVLVDSIIDELEKAVKSIKFELDSYFGENDEMKKQVQFTNKYILPKLQKNLLEKLRK